MRSYREQLRVPASWWLLAVPVILILGSEVWAGLSLVVAVSVYALLTVVIAGFLLSWGAATIEVTDGKLRAGRDTLPLDSVGDVVALDEEQAALVRGPRADPAAHLMLRPYLKRAVYIAVADPASEVPYWLVGTRRPAELAAAIERSRETVG